MYTNKTRLAKLTKKVLASTLCAAMVMTSFNVPATTVEAAGNYNYGDALSKALLFYQIQESGKLSDETKSRINWRDDSCLNDGADAGLDLTGGWFDAGDHVKFNLPMAYSSMMLGWSYLNNPEAYKKSGQDKWLLHNIEWANDYFVKCNPDANTYYYQVGDGGQDHGFWAAPECVEAHMERPSYKVDSSSANGGSCVAGGAAASLAVAYLAEKNNNPAKAATYLAHAKTLFEMADKAQSDAGYKAANGYYTSWSGFQDELALSAAWLYKATGDEQYLAKAEKYAAKYGVDPWPICWDDVHLGALMVLAEVTGKQSYYDTIEGSLEPWISLKGGNGVEFTSGGLGWCSQWGSVRYANAAAFMAAVYSGLEGANPTKAAQAEKFAIQTVNYTLGSSGQVYMCGYNDRSPVEPHHRAAHGTWYNSCEKEPHPSRHVLVGAIVGGPESASDSAYKDDRTNYITNEVACDYNAGFTGACAFVYEKTGFGSVVDATAIETPDGKEYIVDKSASANNGGVEMKVTIYNHTAWPARVDKSLKLRLFVKIGSASASSVKASSTYCQYPVTFSELKSAGNGLYYVDVDMTGASVYPGGENKAKCEMQIRISGTGADFTGSPCLGNGGYALYSNGELVLGSDVSGDAPEVPTQEPTQVPTAEPTKVPTAEPTQVPTAEPTKVPTVEPTKVPTAEPTKVPTAEPTKAPTEAPASDFTEVPGSRIPTRDHDQVMVFFKSADGKDCDEHRCSVGDKVAPAEWIVNNIEHAHNGWGQPVVEKIIGWRSTLTGKVYATDKIPAVTAPVSYYAVFENAVEPTVEPTKVPTAEPTKVPTQEPTKVPTQEPTKVPTAEPTKVPSTDEASDITVTTDINNWGSGYQVQFKVANKTNKTVDGWTLKVSKNEIIIDSSWNVNVKEENGYYVITPVDWNKTIVAGKTVEFGVQGSGKVADKLNVIVNGKSTSGSVDPTKEPKTEEPKTQEPKTQEPKTQEPKTQEPKTEEPSTEAPTVEPTISEPGEAVQGDDWLHTEGNKILDMNGNQVLLTGANWFGFNCSEKVFHGLWNANLKEVVETMADHGINLVRVPICTEVLLDWKAGKASKVNINTYANPELKNADGSDMNNRQIFDTFVNLCKKNGIKIMMDLHSVDANNSGHNYPVWYGNGFSTEDWINGWVWFVNEYKNDDTIIACDLKNEPHGKYSQGEAPAARWDDSKDESNWAYAASRCGKAILAVNPNLLIMVEGIEETPRAGYDYSAGTQSPNATEAEKKWNGGWWGGNLRNAGEYPVDLGAYQSQLVYSPHDYGPLVYAQEWFKKDFSEETLLEDVWYDSWFYLHDQNIAPLLIGEWGGFMDGGDNEKYLNIMASFIAKNKISHTFWCINPNSGDTGGLLKDDWSTWDMAKYNMMKKTLWQVGGKFVGLDHQVPLGKTGTSVGKVY